MTTITFKQKRLFSSKEFILTSEELTVREKSPKEHRSYTIRLDSIGRQIVYHSEPLALRNFLLVVFVAISLWSAFAFFDSDTEQARRTAKVNMVLFPVLSILVYLVQNKKDIHISGGQYVISLFEALPNKEGVDKFINILLERQKAYIYKKYAKVDPDLPEEQQMNTFYWLLSNDIIDEEEYEHLKKEYKRRKLFT